MPTHGKLKVKLSLKVNSVINDLNIPVLWADTDKQQAINLFLGTFKPHPKRTNIWDIPTDYYLHHRSTMNLKSFSLRQRFVFLAWKMN